MDIDPTRLAVTLKILEIIPAVLIRSETDGMLAQQFTLKLAVDAPVAAITARATIGGRSIDTDLGTIASGESDIIAYIPEPAEAAEAVIDLIAGDEVVATTTCPWTPPRHWTVHVVQRSHHDAGYTDLKSHVLPELDRYLEEYLELARASAEYPDAAQARIVVEQTWSIDHYMRHASPASVTAMTDLIRSGHVELTALFGNMTTELCGHETLIRTLYATAALARKIGVPIVSAEHADIPGMAWGLSEIMADAGVKIFCPAMPLYYGWGGGDYPSFWDEEAVFGTVGIPGAFWWQTPSGRRLLVWSNNHGCNGPRDRQFPELADQLHRFEDAGYPFSCIRWPVMGGYRDNAPYIDYATAVKTWNETWSWPRLVSSTNARFYDEFVGMHLDDLPVHRGDMPGQDYPVGATSTAVATGVNRANHAAVPRAETLAALAAQTTEYDYQADRLAAAYEETIWHDEHTWGHHFPCGPSNLAGELEKAVHAHRAAALAQDVHQKAMARIADAVTVEDDGIHLMVFNPSPYPRSDFVCTPMREIDNCGSEMVFWPSDESGGGTYGMALLGHRNHVTPEPEYVRGEFDLVDVDAGCEVPYEIAELDSPMTPVPYAAERIGLSVEGQRFGIFEKPVGLKRDLQFTAENVPALGFRTYRLAPRQDKADTPATDLTVTDSVIENEYYRVEVCENGTVSQIFDKTLERELIATDAAHRFGSVIVRQHGGETESCCTQPPTAVRNALRASIRWRISAPGHPVIEQVVTLMAGVRRVEFAMSVLKDPTPRMDVSVAFPFAMPDGRYTLQEPLHAANPETDRLPGTFSNRLTVQDWLKISDGDTSVLWSSIDAPIVSIGRLWPDRTSPAHNMRTADSLELPPQEGEELRGGSLYSCICFNDMDTNFSVSQNGLMIFRYVIGSNDGDASFEDIAAFADSAVLPMSTIMTKAAVDPSLPPADALLAVDNAAVRLLTFKQAENKNGHIIRLWNPTADAQEAIVTLPKMTITDALRCNVVETENGDVVPHDVHSFSATIAAGAVATIRIIERNVGGIR